MRQKWTIILVAVTAVTSAMAQPEKEQGRHPAYAEPIEPRIVRTVPLVPQHTFEERWAPAQRLIEQQYRDRLYRRTPEEKNAPPATAEPMATVAQRIGEPIPIPRAQPLASLPPAKVAMIRTSIRKPDQATCVRHGLRTIWSGQSWRCRK